jgi:hypothetical protein
MPQILYIPFEGRISLVENVVTPLPGISQYIETSGESNLAFALFIDLHYVERGN